MWAAPALPPSYSPAAFCDCCTWVPGGRCRPPGLMEEASLSLLPSPLSVFGPDVHWTPLLPPSLMSHKSPQITSKTKSPSYRSLTNLGKWLAQEAKRKGTNIYRRRSVGQAWIYTLWTLFLGDDAWWENQSRKTQHLPFRFLHSTVQESPEGDPAQTDCNF